MGQYVYSVSDRIAPAYCLGCKHHIPKVVLNAGLGYCPVCRASQPEVMEQLRQNALLAEQRAEQARANQVEVGYSENTGFGQCPKCHSTNVVVSRQYTVAAILGITVIVLFFLVGMIVVVPAIIVFLIVNAGFPGTIRLQTYYQCRICRARW